MLKIFLELNIRILMILLSFGIITSFLRHSTYHNLSRKKHGGLLINIFNLVGIPIHELGHLFFALLFGYQITGLCLYRTIRQSMANDGTLGYVKMQHSIHNSKDVFQVQVGQFFVGIGPLISGPFAILSFYALLPDPVLALFSSISKGPTSVLQALHHLNRIDIILLIVFFYALIGIALNMELSRYDLEMAWKGLLFLEILFVLISIISVLIGWNLTPFILIFSRHIILISVTGIACSILANLFSMIGI